jgi:hypothetical protein
VGLDEPELQVQAATAHGHTRRLLGDAARLSALAAPNGIEILAGPHAVSS